MIVAAPKVKLVRTDILSAYNNNSRVHSKEQIAEIVGSIKEFGFTNPILCDSDYVILAGHGRLEAAKLLKIKELPVLILDGLTEAQKRAYVIADNKIALNADWCIDTLKYEFEKLIDVDFDLSKTGFDSVEIAEIFKENAGELEQDFEVTEKVKEKHRVTAYLENDEEVEALKIYLESHSIKYKCK